MRFPAMLLCLWPLACSAPDSGRAPESKDEFLVTINFYRTHNIGSKSPPTGVLRLVPETGEFEPLAWDELITTSVSVAPDGEHLYLASGNGVMASCDGGQSWTLTGGIELAETQRVWIDTRDPRAAWVASAYGVFRCEDIYAERPWERVEHQDVFRFCSDIRQDAANPERLLVATEQGVHVLENGRAEPRGPETRVRRILQDAGDPSRWWATSDGLRLLASTDGGESWAPVPGSPEISFCVTRPPGDGETLFVGTLGALYRSDDLGASWRRQGSGLPEDFFVFCIAADPHEPEHLCVSGTDGVFESRDGGNSWIRLGLEGALATDCRFVRRTLPEPRLLREAAEPPRFERGAAPLAEHRAEPDPAFEARRAELLDHFRSKRPGPEAERVGLFPAILAATEDEPDPRLAELLAVDLEAPAHSMFFSLPAIGLYLHARESLPAASRERLEVLLTEYPLYRGDTENHWVMHYTAMLLAAQVFPDTPPERWYMKKSSASLYREAREWLVHWARLTATKGQGEFDSPHYMFMFTTPMLLLYDFAEEPEMKQLAGMMLDLLFADYLSESLEGAYCGGHSRAPSNAATQTVDNRATAYHWLYAGGVERPENPHGWLIPAALSSYVPPREFAGIAGDRDEPYTFTELKRVRNVIRFGDELNPPVYKTNWMTPTYCLGSLQGGILQPIQQHTWDVSWLGSAPNSTLFAVHPSFSGSELGLFFPEEVRYLTTSVAGQKSSYTSPDKWISASPWERVSQRENVLLALYEVPADWTFPHVDLHWPRCLERTEEGGWFFGRDGDFLVACFITQGGEWSEEEQNDRLRLDGERLGIVVVTAPPEFAAEGASAFRRFREWVLSSPVPTLTGGGYALTLEFEVPGGPRLERRFCNPILSVDGEPSPFPYERLFEGPFLRSEKGSGVIELTDGETHRVLDFNDFTIRVGSEEKR